MELISRLNWIDIFVIIVILRISYISFQDGLSRSVLPLIGAITSAVFGLHYYKNTAFFISNNVIKLPLPLLNIAVFVGIVFITGIIFKIISFVLDKIFKVTWHPVIEKMGGLVIGILRGAVVSSILLIILALVPVPYFQWSIKDRSLSGMHVINIAPSIYSGIERILPGMAVIGADERDIVKDIIANKAINSSANKDKEKGKKV